MTDSITIESPLDMHLHLRDGDMLKVVAPLTAETFSGAVVMPNLVPPVDNLEKLEGYTGRVVEAVSGHSFDPYMTLFFRSYSRDELEEVKGRIIGIKLYPAGVTTNSEAGVSNMAKVDETAALLEELEIPLLVHGETDGFVMDREREFLDVYRHLAETFPKLKIIMEHITTAGAVKLLDEYDNLHATVTPQHLLITLDDVAGGLLNPHLFCKPIAKRPEDQKALCEAALSAHPKLMFGSDSAPHPRHKKECCGCAAGVFTAPIALQLLAQLFDSAGALDNLQAFVSDNAKRIYGVVPPLKKVTLRKSAFVIPDEYSGVVPFRAGSELEWIVEEIN